MKTLKMCRIPYHDLVCWLCKAQPEVLFEATLAEGDPFKLKAAIADPSGFTNFDGELLELEFRLVLTEVWGSHALSLCSACLLSAAVSPVATITAAGSSRYFEFPHLSLSQVCLEMNTGSNTKACCIAIKKLMRHALNLSGFGWHR